jgi:hypothetical protein
MSLIHVHSIVASQPFITFCDEFEILNERTDAVTFAPLQILKEKHQRQSF